ncbi:MAG: hypothetical protein Q7T39_03435 [Polaromonas sp.]|nr:hypothetical protein [Polaromonas sp.]
MDTNTIEDVELFDEEKAEFLDEARKIVNICKTVSASRRHIIAKADYSADKKLRLIEIIDSTFSVRNSTKVKSSSYDGKPYAVTFIQEFLNLLIEQNLSNSELKLIFAMYSILNDANNYGNVLLSFTNKALAERSKIDISNISKVINTLVKKDVLQKRDGCLFLNYAFFYRGSKLDYDAYKSKFDPEPVFPLS